MEAAIRLRTMNKFDKALLERGWIRGEQIAADKAGNQSHAFLARRVTDPEDGFGYILKGDGAALVGENQGVRAIGNTFDIDGIDANYARTTVVGVGSGN